MQRRLQRTLVVLWAAVVGCGPAGDAPAPLPSPADEAAVSTGAAPPVLRASALAEVRFGHLTIEDGLSQNVVTALLQDRRGFLWIGTRDGLNRYDGYSFTTFQYDPFDGTTLPSSQITALLESADGHLWVGTVDGGVSRFDPTTERAARLASSPRAPITAFAEDARGDLWIGTHGEGLHRLAAGAADVEAFVHDPQDPTSLGQGRVYDVLADRDGRLWAGTDGGLYRFKDGGFRRYDALAGIPSGLERVTALTQTSDGALWAGTDAGVSRLENAASGRFTPFPFPAYLRSFGSWGYAKDLAEGPDGAVWCATQAGLVRFDTEMGARTYAQHAPDNPDGLSGNDLLTLLWDRSDVMWAGTNGYGLDRLDVKSARFGSLDTPAAARSLSNTFSARSILEASDGRRWVHAERFYVEDEPGGELVVFTPPDLLDSTPSYEGLVASSILQDREGTLWFTGDFGLYRFNPDTRRSKHYGIDLITDPEDRQRGVFEDRAGAIWVVSYQHVIRLDDAEAGRFHRVRHTPEALSPDGGETFFLTVHEDGQGRFWIPTDTGLLRFDPGTETSRWYRTDPSDPTSLSHDFVRSVLPDPETPEAVLWIGTAGGGLNRFDLETETFRHITEADGLPNNVVYGVLPDGDGRLWMSTNRGLARYDPRSGAIRSFDSRDGLQSNEFNTGSFHRGASGRLYFGGIYGVNVFDPDAVVDNPHVPPVVLTEVRIGDRPVVIGDSTGLLDLAPWATETLRLSHRENMVTFSFAALDFSAPDKNRYAYRMEGFDESWIQSGTARTATYTNLPPGRYTFRVRGSNNDGVWNEEGASLSVTVAPPWWRAWWAWLAYAGLALGLGTALYRSRQNQLRLRHRMEIERLEAEQLRALDRSKSAFFANVSHEFRTPLTLTLGPLDDVLAGEYGPVPEEASAPLGLARRSAGRVLGLINQILDVSRLEAGHTPLRARRLDLGAFAQAQLDAFAPLAAHRQIAVEVTAPEAPVEVWADPEQLGTILANLLSNAFKFTPGGGTVTVTVWADDAAAHVGVRDTGPGIAEADLAHVFDRFYQAEGGAAGQPLGSGIGLALARELAALHGGTLTAESTVGEPGRDPCGSAFTLAMPLGRDHLAPEQVEDRPWTGAVAAPSLDALDDGPATDPATDPAALLALTVDDDVTTVLVADDQADIRAFVRRHLEGAGYRVVEAADGQEALARVRERLPDLVVSDVMMPRLDGLGLCRALRSDPETDFVPILLLTAKAAPEDRLDGLAEACDDYLTKPFDVRELVARVDNLIALRRRLRERFSGDGAAGGDGALPPIESADGAFVGAVREAIDARLGDDTFSVGALAEAVGMSRSHLLRQTTVLLHATPSDLIRTARLDRAAHLLAARAGTVSEVAYGVGFKSVAHFSNAFLDHTGSRPSAYAEASE